jgi:hypothetical protein
MERAYPADHPSIKEVRSELAAVQEQVRSSDRRGA